MTDTIRGAVVITNAKSRKKLHKIAGKAIQWAQKLRGYFAWRAKHAVLYIGKLSNGLIVAALKSGKLVTEAKRRGLHPAQVADMLTKHDDWCLSMTTPVGRWERWSEICRQPHAIYLPKFVPEAKRQAYDKALESAAWNMIDRDYDEKQLGGIALNWLFGIGRKAYKRIIDGSEHTTVCSGAVAYAYRRALKKLGLGVQILGGTHSEKVAPADFAKFDRDFERAGGTDERL